MLAVGWMLSGFMVGQAQHLGYIVCAAWLPFVYYYYLDFSKHPRWQSATKLALVLFLLLSGGYPGIFVTAGYSLLGMFGFRMLRWFKPG